VTQVALATEGEHMTGTDDSNLGKEGTAQLLNGFEHRLLEVQSHRSTTIRDFSSSTVFNRPWSCCAERVTLCPNHHSQGSVAVVLDARISSPILLPYTTFYTLSISS
jgi:hypothetical protein